VTAANLGADRFFPGALAHHALFSTEIRFARHRRKTEDGAAFRGGDHHISNFMQRYLSPMPVV
jgi:hypothetical protein